jgi:hypothetical protein
MAKKQLRNQLRKIKTREVMDKKRGGNAPDRLMMFLDPKNSHKHSPTYDVYDDSALEQEW